MSIVRGLKNINKAVSDEDAKFSGSGDTVKTKWFKIEDKQSVKVLFLQELDEESENFSKKNDLGIMAVEHVNPRNWMRKAVCTANEGECYGCEQHDKDWKAGWKQKQRLYINVLVDDGENEPYVAVLSQGFGPKSITQTLMEYAGEDGTITDKWFKIKRNGKGAKDTSYMLMPGAASSENVEDHELFDLDAVLRNVEYDKQEAHYNFGLEPEVASEVDNSRGGGDDSHEW
jgi:hypothetical protein